MRIAAFLVGFVISLAPAIAQDNPIVGVWRTQFRSPPDIWGMSVGLVVTSAFDASGNYRTEILSEGGNGSEGAAGTFVDTGVYRFTPPDMIHYQRRSYVLCIFSGCQPARPLTPDVGDLKFDIVAPGQARTGDGAEWTRIQ